MKRLVALCLTVGMLLPIMASCTSPLSSSVDDTTSPQITAPVETEPVTTDRSQSKDNLPENLRFDGETIRMICRGVDTFSWELIAEDSGEVVESAVYNRNLAVEERLGITLNVVTGDSSQSVYMDNVRATILAQSPDYDVIAGAQYKAAQMVLENCFRDLANEKYLDFDQPWWDTNYMENLSVDSNQIYMLAGDLTLTKIAWTGALYFNKSIYQNAFGAPEDFYKTVLDGKWTLDMLSTLCAEAYQDLNGDGKKDESDIMGMYLTDYSHTDRISFAMGVRYSERDENGYPTLVLNNERTVRYVEGIVKFFNDNPGTYFVQKGPDHFIDGRALFTSATLYDAIKLSNTDVEYGILPWPKLDEEQQNYYSGVQDNVALYMIPVTVDDARAEMLCAVLEAMCSENYRKVTRAFYETALKFKYSDGELYTSVVDLIHNSATTDIVYVYNYALSEVATLARTFVATNNSNFASAYKKIEEPVEASLDKLIAYFTEN